MTVRELIKALEDGGYERMDWLVMIHDSELGLQNVSYVGETNGAPEVVMLDSSPLGSDGR